MSATGAMATPATETLTGVDLSNAQLLKRMLGLGWVLALQTILSRLQQAACAQQEQGSLHWRRVRLRRVPTRMIARRWRRWGQWHRGAASTLGRRAGW